MTGWEKHRGTQGLHLGERVNEWRRKCKNSSVLERDYAGLPTGFLLGAVVIGMYSLHSLLGPGAICY